jgi:hypothetical protein
MFHVEPEVDGAGLGGVPAGIHQMDEPPMAYLAVVGDSRAVAQVTYRTFERMGTRAALEQVYKRFVEALARVLYEAAGSRYQPLLMWRVRPEYVAHPRRQGEWHLYCRLGTRPPLPEAFWRDWILELGWRSDE